MQTTIKKFQPLLKYAATSFVMCFSNIENVWLEEPWRGVKWDPGPRVEGSSSEVVQGLCGLWVPSGPWQGEV